MELHLSCTNPSTWYIRRWCMQDSICSIMISFYQLCITPKLLTHSSYQCMKCHPGVMVVLNYSHLYNGNSLSDKKNFTSLIKPIVIVNPQPLQPKGYCRHLRLSVCPSVCPSVPIILVNTITQSVYLKNPPNWLDGFDMALSWMVL